MFSPFFSSRRTNTWFLAGLASSFPNILEPDADSAQFISDERPCGSTGSFPGCKVFKVSEDQGRSGVDAAQVSVGKYDEADAGALKDQVLVFQYKGKFHAVDHKCPHMSYPLSRGHMFDIEDFGIVLSAGLTCPKHGWSFDVFTGLGDRGSYRLKIWEVELRDVSGEAVDRAGDHISVDQDKEVWVRRKPRIG